MTRKNLWAAWILLLCAAGCTTYYRVTDPTTGKTYYTTALKQDGGSTQLTDARTGDSVTVQNVEVRKISKEDFEAGKSAPPAKSPPTGMLPPLAALARKLVCQNFSTCADFLR